MRLSAIKRIIVLVTVKFHLISRDICRLLENIVITKDTTWTNTFSTIYILPISDTFSEFSTCIIMVAYIIKILCYRQLYMRMHISLGTLVPISRN